MSSLEKHKKLHESISYDEFNKIFGIVVYWKWCNIEEKLEQSRDGNLILPLTADILVLVECLIDMIREFHSCEENNLSVTEKVKLMVEISGFLFETLRYKQIHLRNDLLKNFECCCATANTFMSMAEHCEVIVSLLMKEFVSEGYIEERDDVVTTDLSLLRYLHLQTQSSEVSLLYEADAVYAAQYMHIFVFQPIREKFTNKLFNVEWETVHVENEIVLCIVRTIQDFWRDVNIYISDDFLIKQAAIALMDASVVFYAHALFSRAKEQLNKNKRNNHYFKNSKEAIRRMFNDINIMQDFFQRIPALENLVDKKLSVLFVIYKCIKIVNENPKDQKLILLSPLIDTFTGSPKMTEQCMVYVFSMFSPKSSRFIIPGFTNHREKQNIPYNKPNSTKNRREVPGLRVDVMLDVLYGDQMTTTPLFYNGTKGDFSLNLMNLFDKGTITNNFHETIMMSFMAITEQTDILFSFSSITQEEEEGFSSSALPDFDDSMLHCNVKAAIDINEVFKQFLGTLPPEEFLSRFKTQTTDLLDKVYNGDFEIQESKRGHLITQLPSDIFSIVHSQLHVVEDYLKEAVLSLDYGQALIVFHASCFLFESLRFHQLQFRNLFLIDFESCCASSNDFTIMASLCEEVVSTLQRQNVSSSIEMHSSELILLYREDAVFSARFIYVYVFQPILESTIMKHLFRSEWEELESNNFALSIVATIEDFLNDIQQFVNESFLIEKAMYAILEGTVLFYLERLIARAKKQRYNKTGGCFTCNERALRRMNDDIHIFKSFFQNLEQSYNGLDRFIRINFNTLDLFYDLLRVYQYAMIGAEVAHHSHELEQLILKIHSLIGDTNLTKRCLTDLYNLFDPMHNQFVWDMICDLEGELKSTSLNSEKIEPSSNNNQLTYNRRQVPGLSLHSVLQNLYTHDLKQNARHVRKQAIRNYQKLNKKAHDVGVLKVSKDVIRKTAKKVMLTSFNLAMKDAVYILYQSSPAKIIRKIPSTIPSIVEASRVLFFDEEDCYFPGKDNLKRIAEKFCCCSLRE